MSGPHGDFLKLLDDLAGTLDQLAGLARRKVDCTRQGDLEELDQCMKREQVITLSLKTLEKKRMQFLKDLGLEKVALGELFEHYPAEMKTQAKETVENLQNQFGRYKSASTAARTAMERAIRDIERMMPEDQPPVDPGEPPQRMRPDLRA